MKKIAISIILIIMFFINSNTPVYADSEGGTDWVHEAFSATKSFLNEPTKDFHGLFSTPFNLFKDFIKAINRVLLVALAGISTISLSVVGVRFISSGAAPEQRMKAKESLKSTFMGMAIGFGAYIIWRLAMSIVTIILSSFS